MAIKYSIVKSGKRKSDNVLYWNAEIRSCFEFCEKNVRRLVDNFINNKASDMLSVPFDDETVVLKKCKDKKKYKRKNNIRKVHYDN